MIRPVIKATPDPGISGELAVRHMKKKLLLALGLLGLFVWTYWPVLRDLSQTWAEEPQYSHGYLVPLFAGVLLWLRRKKLHGLTWTPSWLALGLIVPGAGLLLFGTYFYSPWLTYISLIPVLAGALLGLGGWPLLRWALPGILFLLFMVPLPGRLDKALAGPLQRVATLASTNALQTLGFVAEAEGNIIVLPDFEMGIVEACSGLRMLMVFLATSAAVAVLTRRSLWQRLLIVASAFPIAILCNVIRITLTGMLHETAGHDAAEYLYHDLAGWLMAPLALLFLSLELWLLSRLFVPVEPVTSLFALPQKPRAKKSVATPRPRPRLARNA